MYTYIYIYMYIYIFTYICICMYVCTYTCRYIYRYIYVLMYLWVCAYIHIYTLIYIQTKIFKMALFLQVSVTAHRSNVMRFFPLEIRVFLLTHACHLTCVSSCTNQQRFFADLHILRYMSNTISDFIYTFT